MIALGVIQHTYNERVDIKLDGGMAIRDSLVASNIPRQLMARGRRVVVLMQPIPLVIAVVAGDSGGEVLGNTINIYFESTGSLEIDGTLDMILPGIIKCQATGFEEGSGYWMGYDAGIFKLFMGSDTGEYLSWNGSQLVISGVVVDPSGVKIVTEYGVVTETPNLAKNPDFGIYHRGFRMAQDWILSGQAVLLESS